jgi:hypothetical protein
VVLGHPVAAVAQPLGQAGEVEAVAQGLAGVATLDDRRQVEHGNVHHGADIGSIPARELPTARQGA